MPFHTWEREAKGTRKTGRKAGRLRSAAFLGKHFGGQVTQPPASPGTDSLSPRDFLPSNYTELIIILFKSTAE